MQKNARAFLTHISTLCISKRPAKKSEVCGAHVLPFFFPSYQYVVQFPPKRVTYKGRSTALSFIIVFKCKNRGVPELSLVGQAVWNAGILSDSF